MIRDTSKNAINGVLKNTKFDFVYIDGNHKYEYVLEDLKNFLPNLKNNGFFGLDDYNFDSVKNAIEDFCKIIKPKNSQLLKYNQFYIKP